MLSAPPPAHSSPISPKRLQEAGAECHTQRAYLMTINKYQKEDAYNPFLHREWSALLMVEHRHDEAEAHLNAAAAILQRDIDLYRRQGASEAVLATYRRELEACAHQAMQLAQAKELFASGRFSKKGAVQMNVDAYKAAQQAAVGEDGGGGEGRRGGGGEKGGGGAGGGRRPPR